MKNQSKSISNLRKLTQPYFNDLISYAIKSNTKPSKIESFKQQYETMCRKGDVQVEQWESFVAELKESGKLYALGVGIDL